MAQISFTDLTNGVIPDASDFNDRFNALKNRINNGMEADNLANASVTGAKMVNNTITAIQIDETDDYVWTGAQDFTGATVTGAYTATAANALAGSVVQVVNVQSGAVATGSTTIPLDDTIPQITEGNEFMTLAITPKSTTNKLKIDVTAFVSGAGADSVCVALFKDATANALACQHAAGASASYYQPVTFTYYMDAGTTSATTFRVRAGETSGTVTFNGISTARKFGGVLSSSITITEIKV